MGSDEVGNGVGRGERGRIGRSVDRERDQMGGTQVGNIVGQGKRGLRM